MISPYADNSNIVRPSQNYVAQVNGPNVISTDADVYVP